MTFGITRVTVGVAAGLVLANAAQADISAQDVWSDWKAYFNGVGYSVTATETETADRLSLASIEMTSATGDDGGAMVVRFDQIDFQTNDDGTVNVVYPDTLKVEIDITAPTASDVELAFDVHPAQMTTLFSGTPTQITSEYSAQSIETVLTALTVDEDPITLADDAMRLLVEGLTGSAETTIDATRGYTQRMAVDKTSYSLHFPDPDGTNDVTLSGTMDGLTLAGQSTFPTVQGDPLELSALLGAGMDVAGTFAYVGGTSKAAGTQNGTDTFEVQTTSQGGTLTFALAQDGFEYSADQSALNLSMTSSELPFPVTLGVAQSGFDMSVPLVPSDDPKGFALDITLDGVTMSDFIWGLFDPSAKLPRDPATVILDLAGKMRWLVDITDAAALNALEDTPEAPLEIDALTINQLRLSLAGADLTGKGAFEFDNSAPEGAPKPSGSLDLMLVGGNTLLDTLVEMGLLPEDQAMGARLMMGLLAVPGDAPDTLNSTIEINEQGHISANGQRIQ